jgi:hypothetical protein
MKKCIWFPRFLCWVTRPMRRLHSCIWTSQRVREKGNIFVVFYIFLVLTQARLNNSVQPRSFFPSMEPNAGLEPTLYNVPYIAQIGRKVCKRHRFCCVFLRNFQLKNVWTVYHQNKYISRSIIYIFQSEHEYVKLVLTYGHNWNGSQ